MNWPLTTYLDAMCRAAAATGHCAGGQPQQRCAAGCCPTGKADQTTRAPATSLARQPFMACTTRMCWSRASMPLTSTWKATLPRPKRCWPRRGMNGSKPPSRALATRLSAALCALCWPAGSRPANRRAPKALTYLDQCLDGGLSTRHGPCRARPAILGARRR